MKRVISLAPNRLTKMYLERIKSDIKSPTPSRLLTDIISEFFLLRYGKDARNELRKDFLEEYFKDEPK